MRYSNVVPIVLAAVALPGTYRLARAQETGPTASVWIERALVAVGATAAEDSILHLTGMTVRALDDQSDRPYPPYILAVAPADSWFAPATAVERTPARGDGRALLTGPRASFLVEGELAAPAGPEHRAAFSSRAMNPWAVLGDWRRDPDIRLVSRESYRGASRVVLERMGPAGPERLFLDPATSIPVKLDREEPHYFWGQVHAEYVYVTWWDAGRALYPISVTRLLDGSTAESRTVWPGQAELVPADAAPRLALTDTTLTLPAEPAAPFGNEATDTTRVGDQVFLLSDGRFTSVAALLGDTVWILDAAAGEQRARRDSAWIGRLFPGEHPVAAVAMNPTWPHIAGLRYWAAVGAPIYTRAGNEGFLRRFLERRWTRVPDLLERRRAAAGPKVRTIAEATDLAGGDLSLYPMQGIDGGTALLAFLPGTRFVWASDFVQVVDRRNILLAEAWRTAREAGLSPRLTSGPHLGVVAWEDVDSLFRARADARGTAPPPDSARARVLAAIGAMGSETAWRSLRTLRLEGIETERMLGVATEDAAPGVLYVEFDELRDVRRPRARRHAKLRLAMRPDPIELTRTTDETGSIDAVEALELAPERLLLRALDAPDLASRPDTAIEGGMYHVVAFGREPVKIFLDVASHLPRGWSVTRAYPDDIFVWGAWGDVRTAMTWSSWSLDPGGLRYPRHWTLARNGVDFRETSVTRVTFDAPARQDSFAVAASSQAGTERSAAPALDPAPIAEGIELIEGQFNVTLVRQDDGLLILEAPHSNEYSRTVLAQVARRFPAEPVKGVVLTTAAWPHVAGVREYVARGIPVFAPRGLESTLGSLLAAPHRSRPDSLAMAPRAPIIHWVDAEMEVGTGSNRLQLYAEEAVPGGDRAGRCLVGYFPDHQILYSSDLEVPPRAEPNFWLQSLTELRALVARRGAPVARVFGLHGGVEPWARIVESLEAGESQPPGDAP